MERKQVRRRGLSVLMLAVGVVMGMTIPASSSPDARPPMPTTIMDPETPTLGAQVDEQGALKVTGDVGLSGTSSVEVSNFPAVQEVDGTVDVGNFPPAPVAGVFRWEHLLADAGDLSGEESFPTINARFVSLSSEDELTVFFYRPGQRTVSTFSVGSNRQPTQTISLPIAVPLDGVSMLCHNEANQCSVTVSLIG